MANILVVDDHHDGRDFLSMLLGYRGHQVAVAVDGEEALRAMQGAPPDLVVSDILMPKIDGYELVRRMRADPTMATTPVIFYTAGYEDGPSRALAASVGVVQFLCKPADPHIILAIIDATLGIAPVIAMQPPRRRSSRITWNSLRPRSHAAWINCRPKFKSDSRPRIRFVPSMRRSTCRTNSL